MSSISADRARLSALEHENLIEAWSGIAARVPGGIAWRQDGVAALLTGMGVRLFNQILVQDEAATEAALAAAVALARSRSAPWVVNLRVGDDDRAAAMAARLGLVCATSDAWMPALALSDAASAGKGHGHLPAGLEIVRAVDAAVVADHVLVAAEAFGMPEDMVHLVLGPEAWLQPDVALYTGYLDGAPVVAGLGLRTGSTIGVYNIATVEAARRRGYGEAITRRVIADGVAAGASVAILQSSAMGRATYERIGFELVAEYSGWVEPA